MNFGRDLLDFLGQLTPAPAYSFQAIDLPAGDVSVLSYNINFALARSRTCPRAARVLEAVRASRADVVLLQETTPAWEALLRPLYPHQRWHHEPEGAGGSAVLSTWPVAPLRVLDLPTAVQGSVFRPVVAEVDVPGGALSFVNVHLRPPLELNGSAGLSTARTTGAVRRGEAAELLRLSAPTVIGGDFNEQDGADALSVLAEAGYADALAHVPYRKETHRWPKFGTTLRKRLDHVLFDSARLRCDGCGVLSGYEEGASDHQPVIARLSVGGSGAPKAAREAGPGYAARCRRRATGAAPEAPQ